MFRTVLKSISPDFLRLGALKIIVPNCWNRVSRNVVATTDYSPFQEVQFIVSCFCGLQTFVKSVVAVA